MAVDITVFDRSEELFKKAAEKIITIGREAIRSDGLFTLTLSGGNTPKGVYTALASAEFKNELEWGKVHFFWGDERPVVQTHPESNYRMAKESLLNHVSIPQSNIHRIAGEEDSMLAAQQYEDEMREFFKLSDGEVPALDLILLGMGDDGHTASLFPDSEAIKINDRLVVENYVKKLNTHRITFTFPLINNAKNVLFLVTGSSKSKAVRQVLRHSDSEPVLPSLLVQPKSGSLLWFLDKEAAVELK
jgi:6-phosphogluconolactonase